MINNTSAAEHTAEHMVLHIPTKDTTSVAKKTLDISIIGAAPFNHLIQKSQSQKNLRIQIFSITLQDINIALALKKYIDLATKLLSEYHDFSNIFSQADANIPLKHRSSYNYIIKFIAGKATM